MSTKAMFKFYDEHDTVYIYKWSNEVNPWDAYKEIKKTFESRYVFSLPRFEAWQFSAGFLMANRSLEAEYEIGTSYRISNEPIKEQTWDYQITIRNDSLWIDVFLHEENVFSGSFNLFKSWQNKYHGQAFRIDCGIRKNLISIDEMKNLLKEGSE